ncbi:hypothetical protein [Neobacillus kokaensis]|uniref:Lipoprotein n=1 Tax=Neobacillus kokaensis TaxID=2759023 RepID=A0ABQ3N1E0_9BACI|nr:hypothetical protein [Neobacillus kokaensis]GHH98744.1 hypothetical protein AM1BK_22870 [Neobacillus kokaensis]
MKKRTLLIFVLCILAIGTTGCSFGEPPEKAITDYLEQTYREKFEVEVYEKGSTFLKNMYGSDKIIVHPKGKPEYVFVAGEDRDHEGEYYDTYVLSKWGYELTEKLEEDIHRILPGDIYRFLLYVEDGKYDPSMKNMSFFDFLSNKTNQVLLNLKVAVKTSGSPNVKDYYKAAYNLQKLLDSLGTDMNGLSIGFVDRSEDITNYIRTANVNNVGWDNLDAKVYGVIKINKLYNITDPSQVEKYYKKFDE